VRLAISLLIALAALSPRGGDAIRTFEEDAAGAPPRGFLFAETRQAPPRQWSVQRQENGQVLAHSGIEGSGGFAVAILEGEPLEQLELAVRLKLAGGERAAGLVWRYQDPDNYYLASLRLGNQSIDVYRIVNGNRVRAEGEDDLELDPAAWHTLRVVQGRERARVYLGGIKVFELRARGLPASGLAGVWSAGDSTAWFDDLRLESRGD
jgi:hypothetical protein